MKQPATAERTPTTPNPVRLVNLLKYLMILTELFQEKEGEVHCVRYSCMCKVMCMLLEAVISDTPMVWLSCMIGITDGCARS
jgi:hypothetical protein